MWKGGGGDAARGGEWRGRGGRPACSARNRASRSRTRFRAAPTPRSRAAAAEPAVHRQSLRSDPPRASSGGAPLRARGCGGAPRRPPRSVPSPRIPPPRRRRRRARRARSASTRSAPSRRRGRTWARARVGRRPQARSSRAARSASRAQPTPRPAEVARLRAARRRSPRLGGGRPALPRRLRRAGRRVFAAARSSAGRGSRRQEGRATAPDAARRRTVVPASTHRSLGEARRARGGTHRAGLHLLGDDGASRDTGLDVHAPSIVDRCT